MKTIFTVCILLLSTLIVAQTGIIKGQILDKESQIPLSGVTVQLLNIEQNKGSITDVDGYYRLENVSLGRQTIQVNYLGYETTTIPNLIVTSGKDVVINISLEESFDKLQEVVISSRTKKDKPLNTLASVSARQFSIEEVNRFSGGRADVGRLAANLAGVSSPDDSRNDIVIRGNSPVGLLWRLEGIPIPNPNHFSAFGTTGGPVSAVNSNMIQNSDFFTSAFPAEYGNAIGGVFDLSYRKGNIDDYEYTFQAGAFSGLEATAEGPLGKNKGSFLVAGRYSLIGLIGAGAAGASTATPNYFDISYNIDFGKTKLGNFSLFGILGNSNIDFLGDSIDENDLFAAEDEDLFVESQFRAFGLKHQISFGKRAYLKNIISSSFSKGDIFSNRYVNIDTPEEFTAKYFETSNEENRLSFSTLFNLKLNNKTTLRIGTLIENFGIESILRDRTEQPDLDNDGIPDIFTFIDVDDNFSLIQPFIQAQFKFSKKITLNTGLHSQYSSLNKQFVLEPRTGINYKVAKNHSLNFGYGLHHQTISFPILFLNETVDGELLQTNRDLDFVQSNHFVIGYDASFGKSWRSKLELYYQAINNAAIEPFSSSYSSLTEGANFVFDNNRVSLVNKGTGFNRGVEITLEKFFSDGYYGLLTTSFFESKYEGSDGIELNTPFNNGYVVNFLTGREFEIGKDKRNVLFFDTRVSFSGGRYYTPINLEASEQAGFEVLFEDLAFSEQYDDYFRWDVKFGIKLNSKTKKRSHQLYFDLQNVTNKDNVFVRRYNRLTNQVNQINQVGFFPDFGYKFQF